MYLKIFFHIIFFLLLVFESKSQNLAITSPKDSDILTPGSKLAFQWINETSNNIDLYYSFDNKYWYLIETGITGNSYNWVIPFTNEKNIYFKIDIQVFAQPTLLWDKENAHTQEVRCIKFISDNKLLTAGSDNYVKIWDLNSRNEIYTISVENYGSIHSVVETSEGIIAINLDTTIFLWDYKLNKLTKIIENKNFVYIKSIDYNPKLKSIALACDDGLVRLFDLDGNLLNEIVTEKGNNLYSVKFSRDGNFVITAGYNGYIYIYDMTKKTVSKSLNKHGDTENMVVWSVDISPNNKYFLSGGVDRTVRMWDMNTLSELKRYYHKSHVRTVQFSSKGNIFLSSSLDSTLNQFTTSLTSNIPGVFINHNGQIISSDYSFTADSFATAGRDLSFKIWKNFDYRLTSDVVVCDLINRIEIYAPKILSKTGEKIKIPIRIKNSENIPVDFLKNMEITLSLPKDLIDTKEVKFKIDKNLDDTINFKISEVADNTLLEFNCEVLKGSRKSAKIDLIKINVLVSENINVIFDDGLLELIDTCQSDEDRLIEIRNSNILPEIFPNPVNDIINLKIILMEDAEYKFEIVDFNGLVLTDLLNIRIKSGEKKFQFNVEDLPDGVFFLKISWYGKSKFVKFIKSN